MLIFCLKNRWSCYFLLSHMTLFSVLLEMISCLLGSNTVRDIASVRTCPPLELAPLSLITFILQWYWVCNDFTARYKINLFINPGVLSADHCYNWYNGETYYCQYGCCGDGLDKHCCTITGIIVGACIGGIILISLIVVAICCCMKHKGKSGRVIGTTTTTSTVAMVGTSSM